MCVYDNTGNTTAKPKKTPRAPPSVLLHLNLSRMNITRYMGWVLHMQKPQTVILQCSKRTPNQLQGVLQYPTMPCCPRVWTWSQSCSREKRRKRSWNWERNDDEPAAKCLFSLSCQVVLWSNWWQIILPGTPWQHSPTQQECDTPELTGPQQKAVGLQWGCAQWAWSQWWTGWVQGWTEWT